MQHLGEEIAAVGWRRGDTDSDSGRIIPMDTLWLFFPLEKS